MVSTPWGKIQNRAQAMVVTMPTDSWRNSLRYASATVSRFMRNATRRPGRG